MSINVINKRNIPQRFEITFWLSIWLILDRYQVGSILTIIFWSIFGLWVFTYGYIKSKEKEFNIFDLKEKIDGFRGN